MSAEVMECNVGQKSRKVIILGLDGATFEVLLPRIERGQLPNLASIVNEGVWGGLQSTTPPFSAQAWVSMATGKNQARHGVVDFWQRSPDQPLGQHRNFVTAHLIQGETLWQIVGRHGLQVGVLNVPVTYPPPVVNGYLISGLLTPQGVDDFVYPAALLDKVRAMVPDYDPDPLDPLGATRQQILELESWMEKHEKVSRHLLESNPVDLFFSVVQALDHLQHLFWNEIAGTGGQGRYASLIDRCYGLADEIIGHRLRTLDGQTHLFLVSDHGFGPVYKWFHVNRFLLEQGLLAIGKVQSGRTSVFPARLGLTPQRLRSLVRRLDVLGVRRSVGRLARVTLGRRIDQALTPPIKWDQTQAISGSPATEGIYINLKGRDPQGIVAPGAAYEALRERLIAELEALRDPETGAPVVHTVHRREDLYEGPFLDLLPDVVFDLGDGPYLASDALPSPAQERGTKETVVERLPDDFIQGRHRATGIFAAVGPGICRHGEGRVEGARIIDVAPTVLYSLGLPIPEDMDGRPLLEIFDEAYRTANPVRYAKPELASEQVPEPVYDESDIAEMERRLRGLGYVS
jgi:predicted AlkP superfamily phosphohydrolase/phosphomutase